MSLVRRSDKRRSYGKTRAAIATVASERIEILVDQARQMVEKDERLSRRYVGLARKISERTKVRIPTETKRYLCKGCGIALIPGRNARVRLHAAKSGLVITCQSCGALRRYPVNSKNGTRTGIPR
ncbi:MAG TPA: ribonuclease P [Candidatus Bathyarchaeia archaeon]|nr:ribonuclease P [Candidatus Bathyarchaeia archaeon]